MNGGKRTATGQKLIVHRNIITLSVTVVEQSTKASDCNSVMLSATENKGHLARKLHPAINLTRYSKAFQLKVPVPIGIPKLYVSHSWSQQLNFSNFSQAEVAATAGKEIKLFQQCEQSRRFLNSL